MGAIWKLIPKNIIIYAVIALVLSGGAFGMYQSWKHAIKAEALAEFNAQQLELVKEEQTKYNKNLADLKKEADDLSKKLDEQSAQIDNSALDLSKYIENAPGDRPASDILKETIRRISK